MHHASADPSVILHADALPTTGPEPLLAAPRAEETMLTTLGVRASLLHYPQRATPALAQLGQVVRLAKYERQVEKSTWPTGQKANPAFFGKHPTWHFIV